MKIAIIHCWGGGSRSCWYGWLADQLRKQGIEVISPDFPNTNNPNLEEWLAELKKHVKQFEEKDEWVLIGHSLGCPFILRLLEAFKSRDSTNLCLSKTSKPSASDQLFLTKEEKIHAAIMVAAFAKDLGFKETRNFFYPETKKFLSQSIHNQQGITNETNQKNLVGCVYKDFNWKKIKSKANKFIVINSDNDPFI